MESHMFNIIENYGFDIKIKFDPFYLECNPAQEAVKLPRLFNHEHSQQIEPKVMLCDPAGNMFQVAVEVRYDETYFIQGWTNVGHCYGLRKGGWAKLVFVASNMFLIHFRDRIGQTVSYPMPAKVFLLNEPPRLVEYPRNGYVASSFSAVCKKPGFYYTLEFGLTLAAVNSGFLHLPIEFCQIAFRHSGLNGLLIDEYGLQKSCVVEFRVTHPELSGISKGWLQFCSTKWFFDGCSSWKSPPNMCDSNACLNEGRM